MTTSADIENMMARITLRDRDALALLYDATSAKLFGVCLRVLNNRSEAEDVLHDVYIRVWQKADTYAVTGHSPMTWLITVTRNMSIDRLRKRRPETGSDDAMALVADDGPGPEAAAIASSERARIEACMGELESDRADAVRAAYLEGETYKDLAARFDVPLNTIRTWLRRSLMKLKDCLTR
ncbi:sigma-70 family RNA polymerase sigma factor [Defluviimonas sp. WL0002]|uniref:Sigma-70 family RNA polymerase sigma factor n=1 Tax=Albidovulum marisflavi TaxID=2984159 RepID=A0ABT2Z8K1_9RHOB|nr:sigma-70 family RNA polymerase sigma factor [Defluviimonas sp. WL0002]MCV2867464.1 sigma-70 family RNA polymerase sigma factor [Defluviimonas sp. WL0002]